MSDPLKLPIIDIDFTPRPAGADKDTLRGQILRATTHLGVWIKRAKNAGIPYVPATEFARFNIEDLLKVPDGNISAELKNQFNVARIAFNYQVAQGPKVMWRWDCCASYSTKGAASIGSDVDEIIKQNHSDLLLIDDPRFYDIMYDVYMAGVTTLGVYYRPWIDAVMVEKFPVEIRVFVDSRGVMAGNYYIQRPLSKAWLPIIEQTIEMAKLMAPKEPSSLDFVVAKDNTIMFLEGGPGWEHGAHPCSLNPYEPFKNGTISLQPEWDWQ